jgi:hypothetical protein
MMVRKDLPRSHPLCGQICLLVLALVLSLGWTVSGQDFVRRTTEAGLTSVQNTNGVAVADYDGDGDLDVYLVVHASYDPNDSSTWNKLYNNQGDGTFIRLISSVLAGHDSSDVMSPMGHKMGASWGDFDNDGWPDLFLTHFGPNQLLRNNGDGSFADVTETAGVAGGTQLSSSAVWFDYDRDGDLDLYVSNWEDHGAPSGERDIRNWLYENVGDGSFSDVSEASGLADAGATWTSVAIDLNQDGLLDLYLANDFSHNKAYLNNGDKTFSESTESLGLEDPYHGMGLAVADVDQNGFFDIYLTNITESGNDEEINPLFLNSGSGSFAQGSVQSGVSLAGWGWGTEFFDVENDGDEDLFVATGYFLPQYENVLFRNTMDAGTFGFDDVTHIVGLGDLDPARGLAVLDYDGDGDRDLLISNFAGAPHLYENRTGTGHWLKIDLEGTLSNRDGYGAVIEVNAGGAVHWRYHHGAQFLAQNRLPVHLGLGEADTVQSITVRWPSSHVDEIGAVFADQTIQIRETVGLVGGAAVASTDDRPPIPNRLNEVSSYPNPSSGHTTITYELARALPVTIAVYNVMGKRVATLVDAMQPAGSHRARFDGAGLTSGVYVYTVTAGEQIWTGRITLAR